MSITTQKLLVGILGLALLASVLTVGYMDAERRNKERHKTTTKAVVSPKLEQGRAIYEKYSCLACHGVDGKGGVPNANAPTGQQVPPLIDVAVIYSKAELIERIRVGVLKVEKLDPNGPTPPLYMPSYKGVISDADMELLVNYLFDLMPKEAKGHS